MLFLVNFLHCIVFCCLLFQTKKFHSEMGGVGDMLGFYVYRNTAFIFARESKDR